MQDNFKILLKNWNSNTTDRQKLQHAYLFIAFADVMLAGIISLIDAELGHNVVLIAMFLIAAFFANAIVWNLLNSSVIARLQSIKRKR